ncbi:MAG: UDP-N-acetylglucosamine 2-epimerase (non-hydrolyzing) [Candidatus Marinamargulisbacteria bacterium]|jgi:UDP-N-acetylglucosamine 2-epimerase (non-hydrolysing)
MKKHTIILVAAARPNFMKIAPIVHALKQREKEFETIIVHTGQHYDANMNDTFFEQLNIPKPDINLGIGSGSHAEQTGKVMMAFEDVLTKKPADLVIVVGDVNSTLACALTAKKCHIPVAHVESGLRSFDRTMPEEINRLATDAISDILFTPSEDANIQLTKEGHGNDKIIFVGNVMIDTLLAHTDQASKLTLVSDLNLQKKNYCLVTLHRPSNVDSKETLKEIIDTLLEIEKECPIILPLHPRTKKRIEEFDLMDYFNFGPTTRKRINCIDPVGYHEMIHLVMNAKCTVTDSGGIQEETTVLQVPCITVRPNTERPITISEGTNTLTGPHKNQILDAYRNIQTVSDRPKRVPKFWDGKSAHRIVDHLQAFLG